MSCLPGCNHCMFVLKSLTTILVFEARGFLMHSASWCIIISGHQNSSRKRAQLQVGTHQSPAAGSRVGAVVFWEQSRSCKVMHGHNLTPTQSCHHGGARENTAVDYTGMSNKTHVNEQQQAGLCSASAD